MSGVWASGSRRFVLLQPRLGQRGSFGHKAIGLEYGFLRDSPDYEPLLGTPR